MTKKELAELLNGRQHRGETTKEIEQQAEENGLVIVFGVSDDLTEFRGAIYDEKGHYEGGEIFISKKGKIVNSDDADCDDDRIISACQRCKNKIDAIWGENNISWTFKTDIPHEEFTIVEDDDIYCIGIIFSISDLK